jgi:hypothetical protein
VSRSTTTTMTFFPSNIGRTVQSPFRPLPNTDLVWLTILEDRGLDRLSFLLLENKTLCHKLLNINFMTYLNKFILDPMINFQNSQVSTYRRSVQFRKELFFELDFLNK